MSPSRRRLLAGSVGLAGAVLAGCLGGSDGGTSNNSTSAESVSIPDDSPVADVEVTATHVVVSLESDNEVSRLNLIAPDGTAFARRTVTAGATTVRIPIIETGRSGFLNEHYQPGVYELVLISGNDSDRIPISLEPEIRIQAIEPAYDGTESLPTGNIEITLENVGSGPTWVYQLAYDGAPNMFANSGLGQDRRWPFLNSPTDIEEVILKSGETKAYVGEGRPLSFENIEGETCPSDVFEFRMMVGRGFGDPLSIDLRVIPSGELVHRRGHALCTDVSIEYDLERRETWD